MISSLHQISISTSAEAEDAVAEMMEGILGCSPSSYVDFDSGAIQVTAFLARKSAWSPDVRSKLVSGLKTIKSCGLDVQPARITARRLPKRNWAESWKRHFKSIEVGARLLIKPSWVKKRPRKGQSTIILDPGLSFGTGQHATTSFCLDQLVACRIDSRPQSFLDIGTGSGILAIAAAKLGYRPVEAFDFDPDAVRIARINSITNRVGDIVKPTRKDIAKDSGKTLRVHDLVCANLISDLLIEEASGIKRRVKRGGQLVLAGILATQFRDVQRVYESIGFHLATTRSEKEWQSGLFIRGK
ncbi:MAG: 50S ribosomal protein L11 methyltransferase [Opitutaceae bacterium]|nr:50S ribosomal protein L11 methyltransferase [Verrucomicrobiales bacterium]